MVPVTTMSVEKKITVYSHEARTFPPPKGFPEKAYIKSAEERKKLWEESIKNPDKF